MDNAQRILALLSDGAPRKAKDIAATLQLTATAVNQLLYKQLKGRVSQDSKYRWQLSAPSQGSHTVSPASETGSSTLSRLCRYYLDCLLYDADIEVSAFTTSKYDSLDYVQLLAFPKADDIDTQQSADFAQLVNRHRRDRTSLLYLGYPISLRKGKYRNSEGEFFKVEPVLLLPIVDSSAALRLDDSPPVFNFAFLKRVIGDSQHVIDELTALSIELGLNTSEDFPDIESLVLRLEAIRPEWPWMESPQPSTLDSRSIQGMSEEGIYNAAVLIRGERSQYTVGLETELAQLGALSEDSIRGTALHDWIFGSAGSPQLVTTTRAFLEALPSNTEQRAAVEQALLKPLTAITGPPGTGKSQVVTNLLVNCAWQNTRALFASKNNKAVDVVESRINSLAARPILFRTGGRVYLEHVISFLQDLLSSTVSEDDKRRYEALLLEYEQVKSKFAEIQGELDACVTSRNSTDDKEQRAERARREFGEKEFARLREVTPGSAVAAADSCRITLSWVQKVKRLPLSQLLWPVLRPIAARKLKLLKKQCSSIRPVWQVLLAADGSTGWNELESTLVKLQEKLAAVVLATNYLAALRELQSHRSLETLANEELALSAELSRSSLRIWRTWLSVQGGQLTMEQRKKVGEFCSLLQLAAGSSEQRQADKVLKRCYKELAKWGEITPCWAVTSLSARGRIPFEAGFFELLIIDEASQCDIASILPLLFRAKRAVIIGDPKQLTHISSLRPQVDEQLLEKNGLLEDFSNWAYSTNSAFNLASTLCSATDIVKLRDHHRSHADIIGFSNSCFYDDQLRIVTKYDTLRVPRDTAAVRWIQVAGEAKRPGSGGAYNESEVQAVIAELRRLVDNGFEGSIGVVTPFRAQANRIRDDVTADAALADRLLLREFLVDTVHKFQGDERDVMIFSPVVTRGISAGALGFLSSTPNLFNVAITRARGALIIIGDSVQCARCGVPYLEKFVRYVAQLSEASAPVNESYPPSLGADYPSVPSSAVVSEWEKVLYRRLYQEGLRPIPQYSVERYCLDLALLEGEARLDIEVDGETYHRNWDGELCRRDRIRNQRLLELGWDVMRFWVYEIRDDLPACVDRIKQWKATRRTSQSAAAR